MKKVRVLFKRLPHAGSLPLPSYESLQASGADLRAAVDSPRLVMPGERVLIPSGFCMALPLGYEGQLRPRSGLAIKKGITLINSPGTIDSDYRGELMIPLVNHSREMFQVCHGDRLAQIVISPVVRGEMVELDELPPTARGEGGFGSTGR